MTFWIIAACITVAALIILTLSICKVSAWGDRAMAAHRAEIRRATINGNEKWEARMRPYFDDEFDMEWEDE